MAAAEISHRHSLLRAFVRRRAVRARVAAVVATLAVAWCAHAATAQPLQASSDLRPLGSQPAATSNSAGSSSVAGETVRLVGAFVVVVGLAFAAQWWLRRSGFVAKSQTGSFEVVARHPIGRGQSVLVARFGPRLLCLQQGRDGLRTLSEISDPAEVNAALLVARGGSGSARTVDLRKSKEQAS